ncbi:MAG: DUF6089 family protein [Bacteroidales bacterium]
MKLWITILMILVSTLSNAQEYLFEIGPTLGGSSYIGEIAKHPFSKFNSNYGMIIRYNHNLRNALKLSVEKSNIHSSGYIDSYYTNYKYSFKKSLIDLGIQYEYNFFSYSNIFEHMESSRFSPYITLGAGVILLGKGSSNIHLNIPIGVGLKYKVNNRINIGTEFTMRWTSTDKLDGISNPTKGTKTWYKNNDWYSICKLYLSFDFGRRKCDCPRISK